VPRPAARGRPGPAIRVQTGCNYKRPTAGGAGLGAGPGRGRSASGIYFHKLSSSRRAADDDGGDVEAPEIAAARRGADAWPPVCQSRRRCWRNNIVHSRVDEKPTVRRLAWTENQPSDGAESSTA